jgi:transposase-like protein
LQTDVGGLEKLSILDSLHVEAHGWAMATYQPATAHSNAIKRPDCPRCGVKMRLFKIGPKKPGYELHSFECPKCITLKITKLSKID